MAEALGNRDDIRAFLGAGKPGPKRQTPTEHPKSERRVPERRIAVTFRLPERIAHALIDASAERRKNREKAWSQQDIAAEALEEWFQVHRKA
jgi:hypothetical protein